MNNIQRSLTNFTVNTNGTRNLEQVDLTPSALATDSNFAKYQEGIVRIIGEVTDTDTGEAHLIKIGSGVVVSPDGLVLSAKHVGDEDSSQIQIMSKFSGKIDRLKKLIEQNGLSFYAEIPTVSDANLDIQMRRVPLKILRKSSDHDILVAAIDMDARNGFDNSSSYEHIEISPSATPYGSLVYAIGHPLGSPHNVLTAGETFNGELEDEQNIQRIFSTIDGTARLLNRFIPNKFSQGISEEASGSVNTSAQRATVFAQQKQPQDFARIHSTNLILEGNSGGLLSNEQGNLVGLTVGGGPRGVIPIQIFSRKYQPQKAYSESSSAVVKFIQSEMPEVDIDKLLAGDEVNTPQIIRDAKPNNNSKTSEFTSSDYDYLLPNFDDIFRDFDHK
jgi:hypothetical protein